MRCASCGFPLAPNGSICRSCGKPAQGQQNGGINHVPIAELQQQAFAAQQYRGTNTLANGGVEPQQDWNTPWGATQAAFSQPPAFMPTPSSSMPAAPPVQMPGSPSAEPFFQAPPTTTPDPLLHYQEAALPGFSPILPPPVATGRLPFQQATDAQKMLIPFGFTVASLCVITGGLILVFVYFLSLGVLATDNAALQSAAAHPKKVPTVITLLSPTAITLTSTPTNPGQQYVDNVAMASAVATTTAAPIIVSNTFKVKHVMYVTFEVHTINHSTGGICLLWYINTKMFTTFAFPVSSSTSAYSYASSTTVGAGYVEIYWSSIASCTDPNKLLAQRTQFTVTA